MTDATTPEQPRSARIGEIVAVLRDYQQLGTIAAVADFRGVQVATINNTLGIVRDKLGVKTTREALEAVAHG